MAYEGFQHRKVFQDDPAALATSATLQVAGAAVGAANPVPTRDTWTPTVVVDTAAGSAKTFTVPAATQWQVLAVLAALTTTANVGNRQLSVRFLDGTGAVLAEVRAGVVQAASLTRIYSCGLGMPDDWAFRDTTLLLVPLPVIVLPAGYQVHVYDNKAIAAATDALNVRLTIVARGA